MSFMLVHATVNFLFWLYNLKKMNVKESPLDFKTSILSPHLYVLRES